MRQQLGRAHLLPVNGDRIPLLILDFDFQWLCLLYTSDAADERSSVDLGGRRIIKKKKHVTMGREELTL